MALIVAIVVFVITSALALLTVFAYGMSDNTSQTSGSIPITIFIGGIIIAVVIASTHYTHITW